MARWSKVAALAAGVLLAGAGPAWVAADDGGAGAHGAHGAYEVWAVDQSSSPGAAFGGTIHIWDGHELAGRPATPSERIDLAGAVATLCLARTGANPVRPHMLAFNAARSHAVLSFVVSGHVVFLDAATRAPVDCLRASPGAGGARQVHHAAPSPDGTYVAVANQNGKLLERITTDYATNTFVLDPAATIDLAGCTTPNGLACQDPVLRPDNAPICPVVEATGRYAFVTLRGGGLFVVDSRATPMQIVAEYDRATVHPNGCGGAELAARRGAPARMYVNSGGGTATNVFEADLYAFPVSGFSALHAPNTPAPRVVLSEDVDGADSHGIALVGNGRHLWMSDRGRNQVWTVRTGTDRVVDRLHLAGALSADPTPDLLAAAPRGDYVFASLRGPNPLTADPLVSTGATPGVGIIRVEAGGRRGHFEAVAPVTNVDTGGVERADVHAIAVRPTSG